MDNTNLIILHLIQNFNQELSMRILCKIFKRIHLILPGTADHHQKTNTNTWGDETIIMILLLLKKFYQEL